jgi:peroxiredoxin
VIDMNHHSSGTSQPASPFLSGPATGRLIHQFALASTNGTAIGLADHKQRHNLVLFFHHGPGCRSCRSLLAALNGRAAEYEDAEAVVLAISSDPLGELMALASEDQLQFPLLSDPASELARKENLRIPAVVITDRFAEIWAAWSSDWEHALPSAEDIGNWLQFIELQCRECEAPEWPDLTSK